MFEDIVAQHGAKLLIAATAVTIGLACLALVFWIIRGRPSSPFIRGGKNRQPRLAVLDAAAVDTRRRLVLIRRDDVEHLVMIGGPTDIVIESRIIGGRPEATAIAETAETSQVAEAPPARPRPEPAIPARIADVPVAAIPVAATAERARAAGPDGVSAMSKVLYDTEKEIPVTRGLQQPTAARLETSPILGATSRAAAERPAPVATAQQPAAAVPARAPERRVEEVLDQARQRVLQTPANTSAGYGTSAVKATPAHAAPAYAAGGNAPPLTATPPSRDTAGRTTAADNPALVSEFERLLEAEMTASVPRNLQGEAAARRVEPVPVAGGQPAQSQTAQQKSREETEAEMARLLGEISANRKA